MEAENEKTSSPTINAPAPREEDTPPVIQAQRQRVPFAPPIPWFQVYTIALICQCTVVMYNAVMAIGGADMVNQDVSVRATVSFFAIMTVSSLCIAGPSVSRLGPRVCALLGGWTFPLHMGSLLYYRMIATGALLGVGAPFVLVAQGAILTAYVPETQRGRAIAMSWFAMNIGGVIASLFGFLGNGNSTGTVPDKGDIWILVATCLGWIGGICICPPSSMMRAGKLQQEAQGNQNLRETIQRTFRIMSDRRVFYMIPLFFCAQVFYQYRKYVESSRTFNLRACSLFVALYWTSQIIGGFIMGSILDFPEMSRRARAGVPWLLLFASGMIIWGGYAFQKLTGRHSLQELEDYIEFKGDRIYLSPLFLYIFYGMYDAFWQSYCYWLIGTLSNAPSVTAILAGAYTTFQSLGGLVAWRLGAMGKPATAQFAVGWIACMIALVVAIPCALSVTPTSTVSRERAEIELDELERAARNDRGRTMQSLEMEDKSD
ncbi:hypothetical protein SI65_09149 [Aspergillus cristatus]|uniref:Major facilitator superfamily (MFS) profile domain-containing protein n=1 Tax=Aspergillus cristatus TaxID=573508 RepID=A0A1E3B538_ASPCR|nr:hypothetical protein SI65_09149 [Aspergillus cristatus]